jgi:rhodanese-related sulfurtransferase
MNTQGTSSRLRDRTTIVGLLLAGLLVVFAGCNQAAKVSDKDLMTVRADRVKSLLGDAKLKVVLVDVRPGDAFAKGHLSGAISLGLPQIVEHDPRLRGADAIVVYQQGSDEVLSPAAAKKLMRFRYANVYDFRGGVQEWQAAGGQLVTGP